MQLVFAISISGQIRRKGDKIHNVIAVCVFGEKSILKDSRVDANHKDVCNIM